MRAALLSPERERWAGSRDAGMRRRGGKLGWGMGHAREKRKEGVGRDAKQVGVERPGRVRGSGPRKRGERAALANWAAGKREKGGKGLGCLSGFRAGSDWLVGFGFSIFLLFSNSSS